MKPAALVALPLIALFALAVPDTGHGASHTSDEVAQARLDYLAGNYDSVTTILLPAAEAGDVVAQNVVANAYDDGLGVEQDFAKAVQWWETAAEQDMDKAVYNLGVFYMNGRPGIEPDYEKAIEYYDRAIDLGYHYAMNNRGRMHELGQGGEVDNERALELYEQAIELGNLDAMNNAAIFYLNSTGVDEDLARAHELFARAAMGGDRSGLSNLGAMYGNAYGVTGDPLASMALYLMSAQAGHPRAAINLAYEYIEGPEGWRDPARGYGWCLSGLGRASDGDQEEFQADCDYLAGEIGPEATAAGQAMAPDLY